MALEIGQLSSSDPETGGRQARLEDRVPQRVAEAVRREEENSEILIGWVQLLILATFGALYSLAPPAADNPMMGFEPVPVFLGVYLGFTLIRLALAYRRQLYAPVLYLSIVIDIGLLMALIWSFHIQYMQPAAFYLKAPTLLYVFIFITLRALRFDAKHVIVAGLVAAAGWLLMLGYAIYADYGHEPITRDFIGYMTSNRILLGAEFDKVISILVVTAILAMALIRARRLLVTAAREGMAAQDLKRFFAPEIARAITHADSEIAAGEGESREAAILVLDIRKFTSYAAALPADTVMRLLADYQSRMVPVIRRHGGTVDKFLGDGIMATFGASRVSETYAADALRALDELIETAAAWSAEVAAGPVDGVSGGDGVPPAPLAVHAAAATGRVIFGAVGDEARLEYTVIGGAVNLAAKLEKQNKLEGVRALTTLQAYRTALAQGYRPAEERPVRAARPVDGVDEPIDLVVMAA